MKKTEKTVKKPQHDREKWAKPCSMGIRWMFDDSSMNLRWGFDGVSMGYRSKRGFIEHPSNIHRTFIEQFLECQPNVGEMSAKGVKQEYAFRQAENINSCINKFRIKNNYEKIRII